MEALELSHTELGADPRPVRCAPRRAFLAGLFVAALYLVVAVVALPDYGPTWDAVVSEYPYGERLVEYAVTGDATFLELTAEGPQPPVRSPHLDYGSALAPWTVARMPGAILSGLSCRLLWTELGWVPPLVAHHLPLVFLVAFLMVVLVRFAAPRFGLLAAVAAALFLVLSPRFFAHAANNPKDVPETVLYTGAVLAGYLALVEGGRWRWALFGGLLGLALVQKANALFVPLQLALLAAGLLTLPRFRSRAVVSGWVRGIPWAVGAFVVCHVAPFPPFWSRPLEGPWELIREMLAAGNRASQSWLSGSDLEASRAARVSFHGALHVLGTTPPAILLLALVGAFAGKLGRAQRWLLVLGVAVPVGRTLLPGMRNYDGVRHFLEFHPFLCLLAGVGLATLVTWSRRLSSRGARRAVGAVLTAGAFLPPAFQVARTHPNGVAYYNAFVGGLAGAQERRVPGATDYWGNSYWQALAWLSEHAEPDARLLVPVAEHVARCGAPLRLRDDLGFRGAGRAEAGTVYVVYITREPRYPPSLAALDRERTPVHEIRVQGGVVLKIHRLAGDAPWLLEWDEDAAADRHQERLWRWLLAHPGERRKALSLLRGLGRDGTGEADLRALFPAELHASLEVVARSYERRRRQLRPGPE